MTGQSIIELDVHGLNVEQAIRKIEGVIASADGGVYRVKVIHGYNRGTNIRQAVYREFGNGLDRRVSRVIPGENQGITEIVLREYW